MKKVLIIVIAIVVVAGAALYFFVFSGSDEEKPEVRVEYSPGDFFTTNVQVGSGATRLLKAGVVLVVNAEGMEEMLTRENARIRDTIIFILRNLTVDEINAPGNQEPLRERIIDALNEELNLGVDKFVEVLFNEFVCV